LERTCRLSKLGAIRAMPEQGEEKSQSICLSCHPQAITVLPPRLRGLPGGGPRSSSRHCWREEEVSR
jgi:hypothetical protein